MSHHSLYVQTQRERYSPIDYTSDTNSYLHVLSTVDPSSEDSPLPINRTFLLPSLKIRYRAVPINNRGFACSYHWFSRHHIERKEHEKKQEKPQEREKRSQKGGKKRRKGATYQPYPTSPLTSSSNGNGDSRCTLSPLPSWGSIKEG